MGSPRRLVVLVSELAAEAGPEIADVDVEHGVGSDAVVHADLGAAEESGHHLAQRDREQVPVAGAGVSSPLRGVGVDAVGEAVLGGQVTGGAPPLDLLGEHGHHGCRGFRVEERAEMDEVPDRDAGQGLLGVGVQLGLADPVGVQDEPQPGDGLLELGDGVGAGQRQQQIHGLGGEPVALGGGVVAALMYWQQIMGALSNLGNILYAEGDYAAAGERHTESLAIQRELGNRKGAAVALNNLGNVAAELGDGYRIAASANGPIATLYGRTLPVIASVRLVRPW